MVAPVGDSPFSQSLVVINKLADGTVRRRSVIPVAFVPMVREKP
jgi:protein-L-isoaspartate O-methyltransferase